MSRFYLVSTDNVSRIFTDMAQAQAYARGAKGKLSPVVLNGRHGIWQVHLAVDDKSVGVYYQDLAGDWHDAQASLQVGRELYRAAQPKCFVHKV